MIERARAEADGIVARPRADAAALVERRTRMAEDKIAAAERAAIDEVRAKAAPAAAAAAEALIRDKLDAGADKAMVDATIAELGRGARPRRHAGLIRHPPSSLGREDGPRIESVTPYRVRRPLPPRPFERPLEPFVRHGRQPHHGRAAASPGAGRRAERVRLGLHRQLLLLGQQHHRARALRPAHAERREDLAADPEIGMAHMRALLGAGKGEGDPPEIVRAGHGSRNANHGGGCAWPIP